MIGIEAPVVCYGQRKNQGSPFSWLSHKLTIIDTYGINLLLIIGN